MLLKISEGNYLNLNAILSLSLAQQQDEYIVILTHSKGTLLLFNSKSKDKAQKYLEKFIESIKDEVVDGDGLSYIADTPEVTTITPNPATIDIGANTTLTVQLGRAIKDVTELTLTVDNKLTEVTPLALAEGKTSATATYRGATAGTSNITVKTVQGTQTKTATVTITPNPSMTVENVPATLNVGQKQTIRINLSNATDYEVQNDNTEALTFNKQTKEVNAIATNGKPVNLTFTPVRGSTKGTPVKKTITVNAPAPASEWMGDKI